MRLKRQFRLTALLLLIFPLCWGAVADRIAVVIDKKVITESEVLDELRLTEFLNDQPLDLGPAARRDAAEHLVDQELIRREMENSSFAQLSASEADALLKEFRQQRFHGLAEYRAALEKYGIAEDQLKQRLVWQVTALRFTDFRFRAPQQEISSQSADRAADGGPAAPGVDQQMDAWLKQARGNTRVTFKQEAFQ